MNIDCGITTNYVEEIHRDNGDDEDEGAHKFMYEMYACKAQPVSILPPARRLTPADEDFYPTVAYVCLISLLSVITEILAVFNLIFHDLNIFECYFCTPHLCLHLGFNL